MADREYTPKGQGNYNTVGASAGIASFLGLNAGNVLNGGNNNTCSENTPVTRYELDMALQLAAEKSKNSLLEASIYTDNKFAALGDRMIDRFAKVDAELREVAVYQGVNTATIRCLQGQIQELMGIGGFKVNGTNVVNTGNPVVVTNTPCNPVYTQSA